ncbi:MAG: hypothetical protein ACI8PZ_006191 [Myxococcota bacterium]|jgi:hypothetical protein
MLILAVMACMEPRSVGALAEDCASCHVDHGAAFNASAHGDAAGSALFGALRAEALEAGGEPLAGQCDACHSPGPSGDGIGCVTCHAAAGNQGTHDGRLVLDLRGPVRGPTGRADGAPHDTLQGSFLGAAELCGTCHDSTGPPGFVESPFEHWSRSPAAAAGIGCQDCHMSPIPGEAAPADRAPIVPTGAARPVHDHRVVGLSRDPRDAAALLAGVLDLDLRGAEATLTSRALGHSVPDGASFLREVVLDLEALDDHGVVLDRTRGWLSAAMSRKGRPTPSPVRADALEQRSLAPGESRRWTVPTAGASRVRACVRFRAIREDLAAHLSLPVPDVVDVLCAEGPAPG